MGFKDITIRDIGARTSFTRTSIYNYFQTKEEIFLALLQREYEAWIEDVVVDAAVRGFGAGEALVRAAQAHAAAVGAGKVMLTSNPSRGAARRLYAKMGFKEAETTVFACKTDTE